MKKITLFIGMFAFAVSWIANVQAQTVEISGQFKPRLEFRNGYGTLIPEGVQPANFISQRTRLNFNFTYEKFSVGLKVQNVGVWGETSTLSRTSTNGTMIHEAWGQVNFSDKVALKVGRQELSYDDQRILGAVDWAQQARRHDAALVKLKFQDECNLHIGLAYNAMMESNFKFPYSINNYKALQFVHWNRRFNDLTASALLINNGLPYTKFDDTTSIGTPKEKIAYSQTIGGRTVYIQDKWDLTGSLYIQTGKVTADTSGDGVQESKKKLFAFYFSTIASYELTDVFNLGAGFEYLSGNSMKDPGDKDKAFKPLYGTNHKFNGYMDYFYVGNHFNSVGLFDFFIPMKFAKDKFSGAIVPHIFTSTARVYGFDENGQGKDYSSYLGTEIDIVAKYAVADNVAISAGYSVMFAGESMKMIKNVANPKDIQNWAFVMVNITPTFFKSKSE
jgi:hypothetical protein